MNSISNFRDIAIRLLGFAATALLFIYPNAVSAQIYNWQTGQVIPGTESINVATGPRLENWNTAGHELEYADFRNLNLRASYFYACDLAWADFTGGTLSTGLFLNSRI